MSERERVCVCVCVCERARERERRHLASQLITNEKVEKKGSKYILLLVSLGGGPVISRVGSGQRGPGFKYSSLHIFRRTCYSKAFLVFAQTMEEKNICF